MKAFYSLIKHIAEVLYWALFFLILWPRFMANPNNLDTFLILIFALYFKTVINYNMNRCLKEMEKKS